MKQTVLFFTPEAGVEAHLISQCMVAKTIEAQGHKVLFARCFEIFRHCPVMDMYSLPTSLERPVGHDCCKSCLASSQRILQHYGLEALDLRPYYTDDIEHTVSNSINDMSYNPQDFTYEGIEFGKIVGSDFILSTKHHDFNNLTPEHQVRWRSIIGAMLSSYLVVGKILDELPIDRIAYMNDYALLLSARLAAEKRKVPAYFISLAAHMAASKSDVVILPKVCRTVRVDQLNDWKNWQDLSVPKEQIKASFDDLLFRCLGNSNFVYSPNKANNAEHIFETLNLDRSKKLLVAFTSSLDEMKAGLLRQEFLQLPDHGKQTFGTDANSMQIDWLQTLIDHVESREDLQLVVRIHPREDANKRENKKSLHLEMLEQHFKKDYQRCRIVWPQDNISSYDLGEVASVVLTAYSTIGLEFARLGVPAMAAYKGYTIVDTPFIRWAPTKEAYLEELDKLLTEEISENTLLQANRCHYMMELSQSIDISDLRNEESPELPDFKPPTATRLIEDTLVNDQSIIEYNFQKLKTAQSEEFNQEEIKELHKQCKRIIHLFCTGQEIDEDFILVLVQVNKNIPINLDFPVDKLANDAAKIAMLFCEDGELAYFYEGQLYSRFSPMCERLAKIAKVLTLQIGE